MFFKKEQTHKIGYSDRLASVDVPTKQESGSKLVLELQTLQAAKSNAKHGLMTVHPQLS